MAEEIKFNGAIITEAQREFSKTFGKSGSFTVRIPLPYQKASIMSNTARATGGLSVNSMREEDYEYIRMIMTLQAVIVQSPPWWSGAQECPDDKLLFDLWKFYIDSEGKFQESLKKKYGARSCGKTQVVSSTSG